MLEIVLAKNMNSVCQALTEMIPRVLEPFNTFDLETNNFRRSLRAFSQLLGKFIVALNQSINRIILQISADI